MVDNNCIIEGNVKFRDGKKWKSRWCVMRKLSPVADQQFLILISSAPTKAKLVSGPAHLHVQDRRFCITTGMPPRLAGVWEIAHLRRYGVVEGRFCFEGGSRCGRGEGLHVLITDQGDDIIKTLQLAAEGKLSTRKRPAPRELAASDSPRRQFSRSETRASDFFPSTLYNSGSYEGQCDSCKNESSPYWSSAESRQQTDLDSDYGCRDTVSISEMTDQPGEWRSCSIVQQNTSGLERCSSCISKLGNLSKSSTSGTNSGTAQSSSPAPLGVCQQPPRAFDRLSLSSYSSSSHESDYSVSQQADCHCMLNKVSQNHFSQSSPKPIVSPPRPPKPHSPGTKKAKKPPMPLPPEHSCTCPSKLSSASNKTLNVTGPYENYDVPKAILRHTMSMDRAQSTDQYYDTPRKIKECLALPKSYANYDTPLVPQAVSLQQCGCPTKMTSQSPRSSACPCHNVMSWAGFVLPYCRRGAGIVLDAVHPVRLSGEGKMPVLNASGEIAVYATNEKSSGTDQNSMASKDKCGCQVEGRVENNYENIEPVIDTQPEPKQINYANIDFTQSLEHYENSKDILAKVAMSQNEVEKFAEELKEPVTCVADDSSKVCIKCGHAKDGKNDYLMMNPEKEMPKKPYPGYLPMQPAHNACSKEVLSRICSTGKSNSNPALAGSQLTEGSKKRSESEYRVPGSAMLSSPYLRRRFLDSTNCIDTTGNVGALARKRSYSAESAHYTDDEKLTVFPSTLTIHKCPSEADKGLLISKERQTSCMEAEHKTYHDSEEISAASSQPCSIKIRRSSSVPSKAGHNRDSSSSNDSGVSTGSLSHRGTEFGEFELPIITATSGRKHLLSVSQKSPPPVCFHSSLPRKSKSSDPLRELSFQFQKLKIPTKSSSAEGDIPTCVPKGAKSFNSPGEVSATPYTDSRSTSSGTSDMSDYIETLSLSSHSSSDTPDNLRLGGRQVATTLRPRSGKEYYKIDRSVLVEQNRVVTGPTSNYANITPVIEKSESPSPGYMSSSPYDQPQPTRDHFLFPEQA
ncbi:uncharacterized protein LOC105688945 isoform X2 [Athalia rosae]|uniref:uncharacterized protein LOC105688945 isoform X2 n=1 Tax=Athalia rosae TaxID=37344 RepID=UPI002034593C|nr:uncharacterized protein LOC105688945 isoform X2 [Athalia rosae]